MANGFVRPPELESSVVAKLILAVFSFKEVEESSVKQLPSYEDRNYYLTGVTEGVTNCGSRDGEFVLKISNSLMDIELKMGLNAVVSHLYQQGFECPQPLSSRNGKGVEMLSKEQLLAGDPGASEGEGPKFCVQLLMFILGKTLDSVPFTPRLAYEAGRYVGGMDAVHILQVQYTSCKLGGSYKLKSAISALICQYSLALSQNCYRKLWV